MSNILQDHYEPHFAKLLEEIGSTPTGAPLIDWVRHHLPKIGYGQPLSGDAFAYPRPFQRMVVRRGIPEEAERELVAHELVHMVRWSGHMVGSLEQEYDAYLTAAKIRCEFNGWDWRDPEGEAAKHYPDFFGPKLNKAGYKENLKKRIPFYEVLPWDQPRGLLNTAAAMAKQTLFGARIVAKNLKKRIAKDPDAAKKQA
ncbi:MAG TPA: hypothetical protein VF707_18155 [Ardenticatenaceae bacterium]|jgi:hypothetical protein